MAKTKCVQLNNGFPEDESDVYVSEINAQKGITEGTIVCQVTVQNEVVSGNGNPRQSTINVYGFGDESTRVVDTLPGEMVQFETLIEWQRTGTEEICAEVM